MSEDSFDEFVRVRAGALARTAFLLTGDPHHAEDLVQNALARAAVHWARLDDPEAYVRRVLYTQAVSWWRVQRRRRREVLVDAPPERAAAVRDPDLGILLGRALARLTRRQRAVLILRFYEDRSESETAAILSVGLGTVKSQTRHALRRLRELAPELGTLMSDRVDREAAP
ncbi:SigE family RNA polymerase sigma factor [Virgisporangium ochraceum]